MPDLLELLTGVVSGVAGLVLPRFLRSTDDASLVGVVALAALMAGTGLAPFAVLPAVGLLVAGTVGWSGPIAAPVPSGQRRAVSAAALLGGIVLLGLAMPRAAPGWFQPATMVAVAVALLLVAAAVPSFSESAAAWLVAIAGVAAYGAVPDTEQITAVAGAWSIVVVGMTLTRSQPSRAGVAAATALTVWAIAAGAAGREASLVAWAGVGVLVAAPVWWLLRRRLRWRSIVGAVVVLAQIIGAAAIARGPALGSDLSEASATAALVLGWMVALALLALPFGRRWSPQDPSSSR